jgi:molybdate transport system substrate-binding protein
VSAANKLLRWLSLAVVISAAACTSKSSPNSPGPDGRVLQIFAAASLSAAFEELGARFQSSSGEPVEFNFAGSQVLVNQLIEGAPADAFASANPQQMQRVIEAGLVDAQDARVFAKNRLVVVAEPGSASPVRELVDLAKSGLKLVMAAKEVPAGQYALVFLDQAAGDPAYGPGYRQAVLDNVVSYEENVKIVLTRVMLGEVDAGIVYASDLTGVDSDSLVVIEIPAALNVIAEYPVVVLKDSPRASTARAFIDFMLSEEGQSILAKHGFIPAR